MANFSFSLQLHRHVPLSSLCCNPFLLCCTVVGQLSSDSSSYISFIALLCYDVKGNEQQWSSMTFVCSASLSELLCTVPSVWACRQQLQGSPLLLHSAQRFQWVVDFHRLCWLPKLVYWIGRSLVSAVCVCECMGACVCAYMRFCLCVANDTTKNVVQSFEYLEHKSVLLKAIVKLDETVIWFN